MRGFEAESIGANRQPAVALFERRIAVFAGWQAQVPFAEEAPVVTPDLVGCLDFVADAYDLAVLHSVDGAVHLHAVFAERPVANIGHPPLPLFAILLVARSPLQERVLGRQPHATVVLKATLQHFRVLHPHLVVDVSHGIVVAHAKALVVRLRPARHHVRQVPAALAQVPMLDFAPGPGRDRDEFVRRSQAHLVLAIEVPVAHVRWLVPGNSSASAMLRWPKFA